MITVLAAGDGSSRRSDLADVARRSVGEPGGTSTDFVTDFESRFQVQLLSRGITSSDYEGLSAENLPQSAPHADLPREQSLPAANLPGETAPSSVGKDSGLRAPCGAIQLEKLLHRLQACDVEASASHDVRPKKSNKAEPEAQGSAEVKDKRASKMRLHIQDLAKQDAPVDAALVQSSEFRTEPVLTNAAHRTANPEVLKRESARESAPSTRLLGVEQPEANGGAASNRQTVRNNAIEIEVASRVLSSANGTEAKSSVKAATDHFIVESSSAKAIALVDGDRTKNSVDPESSGAFTGSRSRNSNSSSVLELVSSSSVPAKHSQSRNADLGRHMLEGRPDSIGTGTASVGDMCRNALVDQPKDQAIPGIQRHINQSTSEIMDSWSRTLDLPLKHPEQQWIHVGPRLAEAGFQDDSLGWVSVRAARDSAGLHAVLVPPSAEAERALSGHLNGLNAYLGNNQIPVSAVTLSAFQDAGRGTSLGANAQQGNGRDGCDERKDDRRKHTFAVEITSVSTRARSQSDSDGYESLSIRSGNINSGEMHISLVA